MRRSESNSNKGGGRLKSMINPQAPQHSSPQQQQITVNADGGNTNPNKPISGTVDAELLYPSTVDSLNDLSIQQQQQQQHTKAPTPPPQNESEQEQPFQNALKLTNMETTPPPPPPQQPPPETTNNTGTSLYSDMPLPPLPPNQSPVKQPTSPPSIPLPNAPNGNSNTTPSPGSTTPKSPAFDDISTITYLDLASSASTIQVINSTGRLPRWLQKCTSLQYLVCKNLGLTVIDDWVSEKLVNLKVLRLNDNKINTWPDHLAKLVPLGRLQVIDLEGNPCLELQFRKSLSFYSLYQEAAGPTLSIATIKKYKKHITESPEDYLKKLYKDGNKSSSTNQSNTSLSSNSNTSGGGGSSSGGGGGGFFSRRRKKSKEKDNNEITDTNNNDNNATDPALLKKKSSLSKFKFAQQQQQENSAAAAAAMGNEPPHAILEAPANQSAPDRWANQKIEPSELEKSRIIIQLLADIYELSNRNIRNLKPPPPSSEKRGQQQQKQSTSTTSTVQPASHSRMNSVDVMQHFLDDEAGRRAKTSISTISNINDTVELLEHFITEERKFIHKLEQFVKIYLSDNSTPARKIAPCFKFLPEICRFHSDTLIGLFDAALERLRHDEDEGMVLETLGTRVVSIVEDFHWYMDYSLVSEEAKRKVKFYKNIRKMDSSAYTAHSAALTSYAPTQQHPDCDVGDWLRARQSHPEHSLAGCTSYMSLPYVRLIEYREFFNKLADTTPGMHSASETMDNLVKEVEYRKPIELRKRRHNELQRTLKLKDIYGKYICDLSVIIQSKVILEPVANPASKMADAIHRPIDDSTINLPTSLTKKIYDTSRPETGTLLRFIVFETTVIVVDDQRRNVIKQTTRNEVSSNIPENLSDPGGTIVEEVASNSGSNTGSNVGSSFGAPSTSEDTTSGMFIKNNMDSQTVLSNVLRVVFYDSLEVYYCGVRSSRGGDRDTFVRTLNATLTSS